MCNMQRSCDQSCAPVLCVCDHSIQTDSFHPGKHHFCPPKQRGVETRVQTNRGKHDQMLTNLESLIVCPPKQRSVETNVPSTNGQEWPNCDDSGKPHSLHSQSGSSSPVGCSNRRLSQHVCCFICLFMLQLSFVLFVFYLFANPLQDAYITNNCLKIELLASSPTTLM